MINFKQFILEKKKDKVNFNPDDVSQTGTVAESEKLDEFMFNNGSSKLHARHQQLAKKIDNSKKYNFITRAIAHSKLNDTMRKKYDALKR